MSGSEPVTLGVKRHFSRFLDADPDRLHFAAHSHHPWPDVSFDAHQRAWTDAARFQDDKWDHVLEVVVPEAQQHVAGRLGLSDPRSVVFAPNTHELVVRLLSCLPRPTRILTSDAEFHSFTRQVRRLEEDGAVIVERVAAEPFATFPDRFADAAARGGHHLVFLSQVFFDSAYVVPDIDGLVGQVPDDDTFVVIDGYHGFLAIPTDLASVEGRAFFVAGGYKYAMAGEGAVFLHCPPGYGPRPSVTGWFAGFGQLERGADAEVAYSADGWRFAGATFDPSGLYRFNAVQRWLTELGITVDAIHDHVGRLQERLLRALDAGDHRLGSSCLVPGPEFDERGHFLTFRTDAAAQLSDELHARGVITDRRGDRLRAGLGLYHDEDDVDGFVTRLGGV